MKILIIKFNRSVIDVAHDLPVIAVCDPDLNGRMLAQHELPDAKCYVDTSLAIRESDCDTVLLTISDHAPQLAMLAMAYGKDVLLAKGVSLGNHSDRIHALADKRRILVNDTL